MSSAEKDNAEPMTERSNLIEDFVDAVGKWHDFPDVMLRTGAYFILSTVLGPFFEFMDLPRESLKPNVYFILGSDPGLTHRSVFEEFVTRVLRERFIHNYWNKYRPAPPKEKKEDEDEDEKEEDPSPFVLVNEAVEVGDTNKEKRDFLTALFEDYIIREAGSPEGMVDHIAEHKFNQYIFMGSEYGFTFEKIADPTSYLYGTISILDKAYYGEPYKAHYSMRGSNKMASRFMKSGIYFTMLAMMQDPRLYLTEFLGRQGFLRRCSIVAIFTQDLDENKIKGPIMRGHSSLESWLDEYAKKLDDIAIEYSKFARLWIWIPENVASAVNLQAIQRTKEVIQDAKRKGYSDIAGIARATEWEIILKLTALEAIAECPEIHVSPTVNDGTLSLKMEHVQRATAFLDSIASNQKKVYDALAEKTLRLDADAKFKAKCERVISWLGEKYNPNDPEQERTRGTYAKKFKWVDSEKVISNLLSAGSVVQITDNTTGGRPAQRLYLAKDVPK